MGVSSEDFKLPLARFFKWVDTNRHSGSDRRLRDSSVDSDSKMLRLVLSEDDSIFEISSSTFLRSLFSDSTNSSLQSTAWI